VERNYADGKMSHEMSQQDVKLTVCQRNCKLLLLRLTRTDKPDDDGIYPQMYTERGYATVYRLSVRLSVGDVEVCCSHRLEYLKNNFTTVGLSTQGICSH